MTYQRLCGPQRQPCPNPYLCGTDCDYQTSEFETPHDKAVIRFWDASQPGYYELIDAVPNWWDRRDFVGKCLAMAALILVCALAAGLAVGFAQ